MENKTATTIVHRGYRGIMEKNMEATIEGVGLRVVWDEEGCSYPALHGAPKRSIFLSKGRALC